MNNKPKIVIWDLETLPDMTAVMEKFVGISQWPGKSMGADMNSIICFGYKILGEEKANCISVWDLDEDWASNVNDDAALCQIIYDTLHDADGMVTHNGVRFDEKVLNTRLKKYGLPGLHKIPHVDTCLLAKQKLKLSSNSLNNVAQHLGCEQKLKHEGWDMWVKVRDGSHNHAQLMADYCKQDVEVLHQVFEKLKCFTNRIPNYNLFREDGRQVCPTCGEATRQKSMGWKHTSTMSYRRRQCGHCGSTYRTDSKDRKPRVI